MAIKTVWHGDEILKDIHKQSKELIRCVAVTISRKAKINASGRPGPEVITGNLRRSIRAIVTKDKSQVRAGGPAGCVPGLGSPVEYAGYVELGTSKAPAYPYLRPAVEQFSKSDLDKCLLKVKEK